MAVNSSEFETPDGVFLVSSFTGVDKRGIHIVQDYSRFFIPGKGDSNDFLTLMLDPSSRRVSVAPCDYVEIFRMGGSWLQRFLGMLYEWRFPSVLREGLSVLKTCEGNKHFILADEGETYRIGNIVQPQSQVLVSFVNSSQIPLGSLNLLR